MLAFTNILVFILHGGIEGCLAFFLPFEITFYKTVEMCGYIVMKKGP